MEISPLFSGLIATLLLAAARQASKAGRFPAKAPNSLRWCLTLSRPPKQAQVVISQFGQPTQMVPNVKEQDRDHVSCAGSDRLPNASRAYAHTG